MANAGTHAHKSWLSRACACAYLRMQVPLEGRHRIDSRWMEGEGEGGRSRWEAVAVGDSDF